MPLPFRDYTYLGATQSLCPECLRLTPSKILNRGGRVYFRKRCTVHGVREDFVCSDAAWFDRNAYQSPAKEPRWLGVEPNLGCPYDCGLCTEHEQHTCLALLEITQNCNLTCPMCFASSAPGGQHLSVAECRAAIDALVRAEGQPEVLQLSGGEPTIHPQFFEIFEYACRQPIDYVLINTNGIRLARDKAFVERIAEWRHKVEIYLQFDGVTDAAYGALRGEPLLEIKHRALANLAAVGLRSTLVATLQPRVNADQVAPIVRFAMDQPLVSGVSFQPATYVGRHVLPEDLEERITFPDVIHALERDLGEVWRETDFTPLPCAHPNAHSLAYAYRSAGRVTPLARLVNLDEHLDLLAGGITFNRPRAAELVQQFMSRQCCGPGGCGERGTRGEERETRAELVQLAPHLSPLIPHPSPLATHPSIATEFFTRALAEDLTPSDVFRITTTSFMDAYNFDIRQVMKSCVHFVLPSGHIVPFSAYNVLYREGHVKLPELRGEVIAHG